MIEVKINDVVINEDSKSAIIKGLRLLLLVGNDQESMAAARLLDILLADKT